MDEELELDQIPVSETGVPDTALMTELDKAAADLAVDAVAAPEVQMGAEQGLTLQGPGGAPYTTNADYFNAALQAGQDLFNPNVAMEEIQTLVGSQAPTNALTGETLPPKAPLPDMTAANTPVIIAPEEQLIREKVGETATTTVEPTAGMNAALGEVRAGVQSLTNTAQALVDVETEIAANKAQMDRARSVVADKYAADALAIQEQSKRELEENKKVIERIRQDLAAQPWQSYWGSKEVGDKMMLAIAVGLGAYSQAQIGGQNIAMTLLQSNIDDHNKSQAERFRTLEAQLNSAQAGSVQAQEALKSQFDILVANNKAAYDQVDKQLMAINGKANTEKARLETQKMADENRIKANETAFKLEEMLGARTTKRLDIFDSRTVKGDPRRFVTANGESMGEGQRKDYMAVMGMGEAVKDMEALEEQGYTTSAEYSALSKNLLNEYRELGALTGPVNGALILARFDSAVNRANARDVKSQLYTRAIRKMIVDKLRRESGSAIGMSEFVGQIQTYTPHDNTMNNDAASQAMDLDQVRKYRRSVLEGYLGSSGSANRLWYQGGNK